MANFQNKILALKTKIIDPANCSSSGSLYQQILNNSQSRLDHQTAQFNLGNGQLFNDPFQAADYLLAREYGDTFLFDKTQHRPIFIPPVFRSAEYDKTPDDTAVLDYNIKEQMQRTLINLLRVAPTYWFTSELQTFLHLRNTNHPNENIIRENEFRKWILNIKIMYLAIDHLNIANLNLASSTANTSTYIFLQDCINKLNILSPASSLKTEFQSCYLKLSKRGGFKYLRRRIESLIENSTLNDFNLKWFFRLDIADLAGEEGEHCFFDNLVLLESEDCLQDAVILQSATILTDIVKNDHQEFDFLIFFPKRKLLIGIESKRQLTDTAFKQLDTYHKLFEEGLSDQLGPGWNFFPVISVQKDQEGFQSQHYIHNDTDVNAWLSSILRKYPVLSEADTNFSLNHLKKVVRIIVFTIHLSKKNLKTPITASNWVEYITKAIQTVSNSNTLLFYSTQQLPVLTSQDPTYNKLVITGGFGVGKTFLLQEKAIALSKLAKFKDRVMFVCCGENAKLPSLVCHRLQNDFDQSGIKLTSMTYYSSLWERERNLWNVLTYKMEIENKGIKALLIDECDVKHLLFKDMDIERLSKLVEIIWIAPNAENLCNNYQESLLTNHFISITLSQNLRNSRAIVEVAKSNAEQRNYIYKEGLQMPPANFPSGCPPTFVNTFKEAIELARKQTSRGILLIPDYMLTLTSKDFLKYTSILDQLQEVWKRYDDKQNDFSEGENPYQHLCDGKILIASRLSLMGFEWPTVIIVDHEFNRSAVEFHECNFYLRCTTDLIVVRE